MSAAGSDTTQVWTETDWRNALGRFEKTDIRRSVAQLAGTFIPYAALWVVMVLMIHHHWMLWLLPVPMIISAALLLRIFIFFHDCCHDSFFISKRANRILGHIAGILTFTPYAQWRLRHTYHHSTAGNLDRRGLGSVKTLTVDEYLAASPRSRSLYRLYRNPFVLLLSGPAYVFLFEPRFVRSPMAEAERKSVLLTNVSLLLIILVAALTIGLGTYLLIQGPIMLLMGTLAVWLYYIQHQFEGVYWARNKDWNRLRACLEGSSYYQLPRFLHWVTGNIGFHHIHHMRPHIPNYNLADACAAIPALQAVRPLTIHRSLKSLRLSLWDEQNGKLVSFRSIRDRA